MRILLFFIVALLLPVGHAADTFNLKVTGAQACSDGSLQNFKNLAVTTDLTLVNSPAVGTILRNCDDYIDMGGYSSKGCTTGIVTKNTKHIVRIDQVTTSPYVMMSGAILYNKHTSRTSFKGVISAINSACMFSGTVKH
jgi:hypothetical protein